MSTPTDTARAYVETVSAHDLTPLDTLLADDLVATVGEGTFGKREWIGALGRFLPALDHYEVHDVVAEGDRAVVVYDFVSPTRTVPCVEVLRVADGVVTDLRLVFDSRHWDEVMATARAATTPS